MKLLTPEEVLQALKEDKIVEVKLIKSSHWELLDKHNRTISLLVNSGTSFRLAPEMITIGDVEFPKPETEPLPRNTKYYLPYLLKPNEPHETVWDNVEMDYKYLKLGLIHLSQDNAIAHAKALIKLTDGTCD